MQRTFVLLLCLVTTLAMGTAGCLDRDRGMNDPASPPSSGYPVVFDQALPDSERVDIVSTTFDPDCQIVDVSASTAHDTAAIEVKLRYRVIDEGPEWNFMPLQQNGTQHSGQLDLSGVWPQDHVIQVEWNCHSTLGSYLDTTEVQSLVWTDVDIPYITQIFAGWNGAHTILTIQWYHSYSYPSKYEVAWGYSESNLQFLTSGTMSGAGIASVDLSVNPWQGCVYFEITANPYCDTNSYTTDLQSLTSAVCWSDCFDDLTAIFSGALCAFVVEWPTDVLSSSIVHYGTSPTQLTQTASAPGNTYNHHVQIDATSYSQGTHVYYAIESVSPCGESIWYQPEGQSGYAYMTRGVCGGGGKPPKPQG